LLCNQDPPTHLLVGRPPRLITDRTNTPAGREGAIPSEDVAAAMVARLCEPTTGSPARVLDEFPGNRGGPA
jgi:hypothetical protein